jgi:hypothetical protein
MTGGTTAFDLNQMSLFCILTGFVAPPIHITNSEPAGLGSFPVETVTALGDGEIST